MRTGSVQSPPRPGFTAWYFGLCPLQSIMLTGFGMIPPEGELAATASVAGVVMPTATTTLPAITVVLAHRFLIARPLHRFLRRITAGRPALMKFPQVKAVRPRQRTPTL